MSLPEFQNDLSHFTRRHFFGRSAAGIGGVALGSLLGDLFAGTARASGAATAGLHFPPRVKRVIFLFQAGGPAQQDLFDYKPLLNENNGEQLPEHVRGGQRLTGMSAQQASIPLAGSIFKFAQHGQSGAWLSELLPHHRQIVDDVCFVKSMFTEAINHDPAITFFQTGSQIAGRPSMGAWLSYGLGSMNDDLPSFIVLVSANQADQPLYARLWGSGFLDSKYQGVQLRPGKDPVLYLSNPDGICRSGRHAMLEQAQRAQSTSVREGARPGDRVADRAVRDGVPHADQRAGCHRFVERDGSRRSSCTARTAGRRARLRRIVCSRGGWPSGACGSFSSITKAGTITVACRSGIRNQCAETDQASAALVLDLKQRGLLDDTLVIWGGEFGRTSYSQGVLTAQRLRPRSSPAVLHDVAGRRRHQAGHHLRPDGRLRLQRGRRRWQSDLTDEGRVHARHDARSRSAGDDAAPVGRRSHAADVQVPGPALSA